jgi:dihydrofolate reductase
MTGATETAGRRIVVAEFVTLDGYMVGPDEDMSWVAGGFDQRMHDDIARDMDDTYDTFVFGRATYDIFAAYWPHAAPYDEGDELRPAEGKEDRRVIRALNDGPKVVFSATMTEPKWANTHVVAGELEDEIRQLKREPGKAMLVQGSASIVHALGQADLVDEYHLYVHPVLLGEGKALFPPGQARQDLTLTGLTRYANGVLATTYERTNGADR